MQISSVEDTYFTPNSIVISGNLVDISKGIVMGILNLNDDSFYKGSRVTSESAILKKAEQLIKEGASILDLGAQSTRPSANLVTDNDELKRISNAVKLINKEFPKTHLSIDTFRSEVARTALDNGAGIINDISGFSFDKNLINILSSYRPTYILMHIQGDFEDMHATYNYKTIVNEVISYLVEKINILKSEGLNDIIIDPGFGFSKSIEQNFELLSNLQDLQILNRPILTGVSRKSMIYKTLKSTPEQSLNGSTVLHTAAILKGSRIIRTHDVKEAVEAFKLCNLI